MYLDPCLAELNPCNSMVFKGRPCSMLLAVSSRFCRRLSQAGYFRVICGVQARVVRSTIKSGDVCSRSR
jgi:hypothetical protein